MLDAAVTTFDDNIELILSRLRQAVGPDTHILLMNYYNPFNFGTGLIFEAIKDWILHQPRAPVRPHATRWPAGPDDGLRPSVLGSDS